MPLQKVEDFVLPVLRVLDALGGHAYLREVEDEFFRQYSGHLDTTVDWHAITPNHGKSLWRDYCGSRLYWRHLKKHGYVTVERHGSKGSMWILAEAGRRRLESHGGG